MTLRTVISQHLRVGRPERAWDEAMVVWREGAPRERHEARRLLRHVRRAMPEAAMTRLREDEARGAGVDAQGRAPRPGVVAFPVVGAEGGRFLEARVSVADEDSWPEGLPESAQLAARSALDAARGLVPDRRFRVEVEPTADWNGGSWGLAVGLAALSAARRVPVSDRRVATGALAADGTVGAVRHEQAKADLLQDARPRACMLVPEAWSCPTSSAHWPCRTLREAWSRLDTPSVDLDLAIGEVRRLDRAGDFLEAAARAEALLDERLDPEERAELAVVLLMAANHSADPARQQQWAADLREGVGLTRANETLIARAIGSRAVSALDRLDADEARGILDLSGGRDWGAEALLHLRGPRALLATLKGRHDEAVRLRTESAEAALGPGLERERARCLGDLADVLRRAGALARAAEVVEQALAHARTVQRSRGYQRLTSPYLQLHQARILFEMGHDDAALGVLADTPPTAGLDPALRLRLLEAEIRRDASMIDTRWAALPEHVRESTVVKALFERTRGRLGDEAARARLVERPVFLGCGFDEAARRLPY